jgi:ABC-2 type transport system ATP-binding protein
MDAVAVVELVKDFGRGRDHKRALSGVTLRIAQGTAFGLVGPNGAGKTTLLKTLLGVISPSSGSVQILGGTPEQPSVRKRIGYLPERLALPTAWTPVAFLHSVARLKEVSDAERDITRQLERVGLGHARELRIGTFSKGMRQRLGLAAALIGAPELLILDEPTDGIDPHGRVEVRQLLQQERARGATIFLNSHLLAETERVCDQVGFLVGGQLRRSGAMADLCIDDSAWRVRFARGAALNALSEHGFVATEVADTWTFRGDAGGLNQAIAQAQQAGALLLELEPLTRDLESLFMDLVDVRGHGGTTL